jgi:hypothetical protein
MDLAESMKPESHGEPDCPSEVSLDERPEWETKLERAGPAAEVLMPGKRLSFPLQPLFVP